MTKFNQRGRSIVEVIGVLAIASIGIALAMRTYQKNDAKVKITKTMYNISELTDSIKTIYWGRNSYSGINVTRLENKGVDPKFLRDAYGTSLVIGSQSPFSSYTIQIVNIEDQEDCYKFAAKKLEGMDEAETTDTCSSTSNKTVTFTFN
ncbi:MAG: hypothetical protein N4A44_00640 [Alphaproteobacteria bacterium]|jgi:Tfp pilus assembly protein PilE|nr:hypothetical protein [Alphaproteobacteria bacterium]